MDTFQEAPLLGPPILPDRYQFCICFCICISHPLGSTGNDSRLRGGICPAGVEAAEAKVVELQAKMAKLDAAQEKLIDKVRMPKDRGTPEMKSLAAKVTSGGDFAGEMKREGRKMLRMVIVDDAITHNNYTEWNGGGWLKRDYDTFLVVGAFKDKAGRVEQLSFNVRFARSDVAAAVKGKWTYAHWARRGAIREANVFK